MRYIHIFVFSLIQLFFSHASFAAPSEARYLSLNGGSYESNDSATSVEFGNQNTIYWPNTNITWDFKYDTSLEDSTTIANALKSAINVWDNISTASLSFSEGNEIASPQLADDGHNEIIFSSNPSSLYETFGTGPAISFLSTNCLEITDVDVILNTLNYTLVSTTDGYDVQDDHHISLIQVVAAHEIGHMIGLGHNRTNQSSIMNDIDHSPQLCDMTSLSINSDDIFGASFICGGIIISDYTIYPDMDTVLNKNIIVDNGVTLTIPGTSSLYLAEDITITVNGTLELGSGVFINRPSVYDPRWGGIIVNTTGTLETAGSATISNATDYGVRINGNGTIDNTGKLTIKDCTGSGLTLYQSSPPLSNVYIEKVQDKLRGLSRTIFSSIS